MAEETEARAKPLFDITPEEAANTFYVNHLQLNATANELFLDLFLVSPAQGEINPTHLKRIVIPHNTLKGLSTVIANVVASLEEDLKINIPNNREPDPRDKIVIWK